MGKISVIVIEPSKRQKIKIK